MKHLHEVPLGGVGFGRPVARAAPERLPRLEMSLLLLLLELPGPLVVVGFLTNLSQIFLQLIYVTNSLSTCELRVSEYLFLSSIGCFVDKIPPLKSGMLSSCFI